MGDNYSNLPGRITTATAFYGQVTVSFSDSIWDPTRDEVSTLYTVEISFRISQVYHWLRYTRKSGSLENTEFGIYKNIALVLCRIQHAISLCLMTKNCWILCDQVMSRKVLSPPDKIVNVCESTLNSESAGAAWRGGLMSDKNISSSRFNRVKL